MSEMKQVCHECHGETTIPTSDGDPTPVACVHCNSTGYEPILMGKVDDSDIINELDALDTKMDIIDAHLDTIEAKIDAL